MSLTVALPIAAGAGRGAVGGGVSEPEADRAGFRPTPALGSVASVREGSAGWRAGLSPGDRIVAIDGVVPRDVIDVEERIQGRAVVTVDLERGGHRVRRRVSLGGAVDLGVEFDQPTFDGLRQCNNRCPFCFIRGLPKGLRRSLYIRDDDYRYSFLYGTFVTLTNLDEDDWRRIAFQRLSPLRVSVHATDPDVRARLLAHPGVPEILPRLRWLGEVGVKIHAQVVLCPGINDGPVLERTLSDLVQIPEVVESVAVVPVGISEHLRAKEIRPLNEGDARAAVEVALAWNRRARQVHGRGIVYPSDELLFMAGRRLPGEAFYDGYPQLQNGVGLTRLLLADWVRQRRRLPGRVANRARLAWVCGPAAAWALRRMARDAGRVEGLAVDVIVARSTLFGSAITVSGLLGGRDVVEAVRGRPYDLTILPRSAFGHEGERTLDEWTVGRIEEETGVPVALAQSARELVEIIRRLAR